VNTSSGGEFITFRCECGQKIRVPAEHAGARGRCKACGRILTVPAPAQEDEAAPPSPDAYTTPLHRRDVEGTYSEEDLITHPMERPLPPKPAAAAPKEWVQKKPLFGMLGEILKYPVSTRLATQIFLTGAILFSPLVWKVLWPLNFVARLMPCVLGLFILAVQILLIVCIISIRLMYFSYMLLIIERSAEGSRIIPELPVFQTWEDHVKDLVKVIGATVVAFSPFLVYAFVVNIEVVAQLFEAYGSGRPPGPGLMEGATSGLGTLVLLYAIAAFYMPMVLMILVVTRSFTKAVNPVFVFRSIVRIGREYVVAMVIIFLFLRGTLTALTIVRDILGSDWIVAFVGNLGEPIVEFYVLVVTMHVIGLLYYRNGERLQW